jgi:hypothetical protein
MSFLGRVRARLAFPPANVGSHLRARLDFVQEALARVEIAGLLASPPKPHLRDYEVRVFSQWGEDGIIAYLLYLLGDVPRTFVEFGVEDYVESNTRFLIRQGDWAGVIIEADQLAAQRIRSLPESWQYDLRLVEAFVTRDNVNGLIADAGLTGEIGVLSIDIDGNDYWVWEGLDVVRPAVVVIEFNGRLGPIEAVTIPYDPGFTRWAASHTGIYYGASLAALVQLGREKGYDYVGSNRADTNAFFVRSDLRPPSLRALTAAEGWRPLRVREMRDAEATSCSPDRKRSRPS